MDFRFTDEQEEFRARCRQFAREVIRPVAPAHDADESVPYEVIAEARRWGLEGLDHLQRLAGDGDGQLGVIYGEELHWGCAGIALAVSGTGLAAAGLASSGSPEQIGEWMPRLYGMGDEIKLGAYAVTEAGSGSDVKSLRSSARLEGDEWVLNGTKVFITNGGIADVHLVVATVDPELGHRGQATFIVSADAPGFSQGKKESKLGIRASHTAEIVLENCRVPQEQVLGGMDRLNRKLERARSGQSSRSSGALATFELTRPLVGAGALGIAQAAYEWTLEHLDGRSSDGWSFAELEEGSSTAGAPLLERQRIQQTLADVATEIESSRLLVQRGAWLGRSGIPMTGGQGSMAKLKAGDVAVWAIPALMDLVGPFAQSRECPLEKWMRDAKIYQLFEGTAQVQRLVISRMQASEHREYRRRLAEGAEIAKEAIRVEPSSQGPQPEYAGVAAVGAGE